MSVNVKVAGAWQEADETYVKVSGAWVPATQVFVKKDGVWTSAYTADTTPPPAPILSVENVNNTHFNVRVRMPSATHMTDIKRIRVMVIAGGTTYPSREASKGYYGLPSTNVKGGVEPWSDWFYNNQLPDGNGGSYTDGRSTAVTVNKYFSSSMPYVTGSGKLKASTRYNFAAWAEDMNGNWSVTTTVNVTTGKDSSSANENQYTRVLITPTQIGTLNDGDSSFTEGQGYIGSTPNRLAYLRYGPLISSLIGDKTEILLAKLLLFREGTDHGQPTAKTYGWWTETDGGYVSTGTRHEPNSLLNQDSSANALSKGGYVWKDIPEAWYNNLNTTFRGIVLGTNPGDTLNTQAVLSSQATQLRQGTIMLYLKN